MKRNIIILLTLLALSSAATAQIETPVKWAFGIKRSCKNEATVFFKATINENWHVYSAYQEQGGPVRTSFNFEPSKAYTLTSKIQEPVPITKFEKAFSMNVKYFENSVVFSQKVKIKKARPIINGKLTYMACNNQKCLTPEDICKVTGHGVLTN